MSESRSLRPPASRRVPDGAASCDGSLAHDVHDPVASAACTVLRSDANDESEHDSASTASVERAGVGACSHIPGRARRRRPNARWVPTTTPHCARRRDGTAHSAGRAVRESCARPSRLEARRPRLGRAAKRWPRGIELPVRDRRYASHRRRRRTRFLRAVRGGGPLGRAPGHHPPHAPAHRSRGRLRCAREVARPQLGQCGRLSDCRPHGSSSVSEHFRVRRASLRRGGGLCVPAFVPQRASTRALGRRRRPRCAATAGF